MLCLVSWLPGLAQRLRQGAVAGHGLAGGHHGLVGGHSIVGGHFLERNFSYDFI